MTAALTTVVLLAVPAKAHARDHVPGCNTDRCDKRIGKKWVAKQRAKAARSMRPALASWYGPGFYGNTTACGQTYTPAIMGVAHKTLACGTRIRVCFRGCAVGRVIDRGPYSGNREFDLSAAMAQAVGFSGVATVRVAVG